MHSSGDEIAVSETETPGDKGAHKIIGAEKYPPSAQPTNVRNRPIRKGPESFPKFKETENFGSTPGFRTYDKCKAVGIIGIYSIFFHE